MTTNYAPANSLVFQVQENVSFSQDQQQLSRQIQDIYNKAARAINARDISLYTFNEILNGQKFIANDSTQRYVYRKIFQFGAIAAGAVLNIAHGIVGITDITRFYANVLTVIPDYRPVPYSSITAVNQQIEINLNGPNIVISNGAASPNITRGTCIIEYIKN